MKGWKTIAFNAAIGLVGVAQALDWTSVVNGQQAGIIMIAIGAAGAVLRTVTNTPVGKAS